jgi:hypothetical protein
MNTDPLFVPEQLYHPKRNIHRKFGGQEQGGMIPRGYRAHTEREELCLEQIRLRTGALVSVFIEPPTEKPFK